MQSRSTVHRRVAGCLLTAAALLAWPATSAFAAKQQAGGQLPPPQQLVEPLPPPDPVLQVEQLNADPSMPVLAPGARGAPVVRAQTLLDRAWFSPGEIDGIFSSNVSRAVLAFQRSRALAETGLVDGATWAALQAGQTPVFATYALTEQDLAGPYTRIPDDPMEQASLPALGYQSLEEALGERFHMSPRLLIELNRGRQLHPGALIVVTDVAPAPLAAAAGMLIVDKSDRMLYVLGEDNRLLAAFPVSIGGARDPLPVGRLKITSRVRNPHFTYDPKLLRTAKPGDVRTALQPGPNNPVGVAWLGLSKPHWGIHGTSEPARMARVETNGCVRLTNWDVLRLADLVKTGLRVEVQA